MINNKEYDVVVVIGNGCYIYIKEEYSFIGELSYTYIVDLYIFTNDPTCWIDNVVFCIKTVSFITCLISRIFSWRMRRCLIYKLLYKGFFFCDFVLGGEVMLELVCSGPLLVRSTVAVRNGLIYSSPLIEPFDCSKSCKLMYLFLIGIVIGVHGFFHKRQIRVEVDVSGWQYWVLCLVWSYGTYVEVYFLDCTVFFALYMLNETHRCICHTSENLLWCVCCKYHNSCLEMLYK